MKAYFAVLIFIFIAVTSAFAAELSLDTAFHPPQTKAEQALDKILRLNNTHDRDESYALTSFMWKLPERDKSKDAYYSGFFTRALQDSWEKYYLSIPEEPEGGRYVGFSFIGCGNGDMPDEYFYATVKHEKGVAYIAVSDIHGLKDSPERVLFPDRMKEEEGKWKLDGVKCYNDPALDFHYTH